MEHIVRFLEGFPGLAEMQKYLSDKTTTVPFETSELYSSAKDAKIVDLELRKSKFRLFKDENIFRLVDDEVIQWLNKSDQYYSYQLVRDNITETRYEQNGHFLKHKDYLSVTSNLVEEFTLLLCVTPPDKAKAVGGETIIYPYASKEGTAYNTAVPGNGLLFRKDLDHAGAMLQKGEKHILTANLWATRKKQNDQVLFVTFPTTNPTEEAMQAAAFPTNPPFETTKAAAYPTNPPEAKAKAAALGTNPPEAKAVAAMAAALSTNPPEATAKAMAMASTNTNADNDAGEKYLERIVANQDTSYALPVDCLKGTMLEAHVRFVNNRYEDQDDLPKFVTYECTNFNFEEFGTVAKILLRSYIDEECIKEHAACIDFFGPFANENLLVNLALEHKKPANPDATCKNFVKPAHVKGGGESHSEKKKRKTTKEDKVETGKDPTYNNDKMDVIVCENESRATIVYEVARLLGLDKYIPFKMIFVEGVVSSGYYDNFENVPVTPVALVLGDYNHVFGIQKFENIKARTLQDLHTKHNYFTSSADGGAALFSMDDSEEDSDDDYYDDSHWEAEMEFSSKSRGLGLKVAMGERDVRKWLTKYISQGTMGEAEVVSVAGELLPLSLYSGKKADDGIKKSSDNEKEVGAVTELFHRDQEGKATFTEEEAAAASSYIASMDLDGRVKASLQKKRFELSQETEEYNDYYCNESTYANMNILFVTGVVRLDKSNEDEKPFSHSPFNAWPTKEQKKATKASARQYFSGIGTRQHFSRMGIPPFPAGDY